jgi:hypothetical protein
MKIKLIKSPKPEKKWRVIFENGTHIDFGLKGFSDYTVHKDPSQMRLYLKRHGKMGETWTIKGVKTAGFWSRWISWSSPTHEGAKKIIYKKFGIKII